MTEQTVVWQADGGVRVFRNGSLYAEAEAAYARALVESLPPIAGPVPAEVTMFQARAVLLQAGLLATVEAAMQQFGPMSVQFLAWEYSTKVTRHGALVTAVAANLGLSDAQVDDLFRAAALIEA